MANNNNNNNRPNPFGNRSRFGSSSSSRFGRGRESIEWTVAPLYKQAVRISLEGLGDPLHRLLGTDINADYSDTAKLISALQEDEELREKLIAALDEKWADYAFHGAALLYPNDDNIRKAYTQPLQPTPPKPEKDSDDEDGDEDDSSALDWLEQLTADGFKIKPDAKTYRAIDVGFVLNVLARSRTQVLAGDTPPALEGGFIDQTLICDDPRIVNLAIATGCIEEGWG